jgi:hypothetical protein
MTDDPSEYRWSSYHYNALGQPDKLIESHADYLRLGTDTQPKPKLSQARMSTPRGPSKDHKAISTAPVSEAGTMPMR